MSLYSLHFSIINLQGLGCFSDFYRFNFKGKVHIKEEKVHGTYADLAKDADSYKWAITQNRNIKQTLIG